MTNLSQQEVDLLLHHTTIVVDPSCKDSSTMTLDAERIAKLLNLSKDTVSSTVLGTDMASDVLQQLAHITDELPLSESQQQSIYDCSSRFLVCLEHILEKVCHLQADVIKALTEWTDDIDSPQN